MVFTERVEAAEVPRGTSRASAVSTPLSVDIEKRAIKSYTLV